MTTGSSVLGTVGGLIKGLGPQGESATIEATDKVLFVDGDPNGVVMAQVGSQLAYDKETPDVYIANAAESTVWNRLGSLT